MMEQSSGHAARAEVVAGCRVSKQLQKEMVQSLPACALISKKPASARIRKKPAIARREKALSTQCTRAGIVAVAISMAVAN